MPIKKVPGKTPKRKISEVSTDSLPISDMETIEEEVSSEASNEASFPRTPGKEKEKDTEQKNPSGAAGKAPPDKKAKNTKNIYKPNLVTRSNAIADLNKKSDPDKVPAPSIPHSPALTDGKLQEDTDKQIGTDVCKKLEEALNMIQDLKKSNENLKEELATWKTSMSQNSNLANVDSLTESEKKQYMANSLIINNPSTSKITWPDRSRTVNNDANIQTPQPHDARPDLRTQQPASQTTQPDDRQAGETSKHQTHQLRIQTTRDDDQLDKSKKSKPPPIIVLNQSALVITNFMTCTMGITNFTIKRIRHSKHLVFIDNLAKYKETCEKMKDRGINFFTFTPQVDRIKTMVLKGLEADFEPETILSELKLLESEDLKFEGIANFVTPNARRLNRALPMFLVRLTASSNINKVMKIKRILHQTISWEPLKKTEKIQCKRCQRLGHVAKNCNLSYRCVKCSSPHEPGRCAVQSSEVLKDRAEIYCVHCKSFGHPASYRGCPKLIEYNKIIKRKIDENNEKQLVKLNKISNVVIPAKPYSSIVAGTSKSNQILPQPNVEVENTTENPSPSQKSNTSEDNNFKILSNQLKKIQDSVSQNASNIEKLFSIFNQFIGGDDD